MLFYDISCKYTNYTPICQIFPTFSSFPYAFLSLTEANCPKNRTRNILRQDLLKICFHYFTETNYPRNPSKKYFLPNLLKICFPLLHSKQIVRRIKTRNHLLTALSITLCTLLFGIPRMSCAPYLPLMVSIP